MTDQWVTLLNAGNVIGFPTETVYGLGADATNNDAVAKIFELKSRPQFNPLIVHVSSLKEAMIYGMIPDDIQTLCRHFWAPSHTASSLTIVVPLKARNVFSPLIFGGLDTIALRVPNHALARELLHAFGRPIAAPSANIYQHLSPTCANHVQKSFPSINVLDGGPCKIGLESTIVDEHVSILRHGAVTKEDMELMLGRQVNAYSGHSIKAPGMQKKHYCPKTPLRINALSKLCDSEFFLGFGSIEGDINLSPRGDLAEAAANLFRFLHEADQKGFSSIAIAPIPLKRIGIAINDRLFRANFK